MVCEASVGKLQGEEERKRERVRASCVKRKPWVLRKRERGVQRRMKSRSRKRCTKSLSMLDA